VKSPRLLYLTGVGVGETTLFAVDESDNVLMSAVIRVTHNTNALQQGFARVVPGQRVTATTVDQSLVITGDVGTPQQAADIMQVAGQFVDDPSQLVNRMNVAAPTQVNLQVRIAEVNRNVDRQLGIRWGAMGISTNGNAQWGLVGGGNPNAGAGSGGFNASLGYTSPRLNVDVLLQALSEEGMVTVLAEPNLTARSGESANFLAGGEYPYQTVSDNGTNTEFKPFGIGLSFTPTVLDGNRISLTVETEVSDLNFSYNTEIPSLVSRRAETTVDLASGQSFAIAGLMQSTSAQNASKMPGINNIPVLGALFRSSGFKRGQTELVIIVTPIIVQPVTARRVRTPVDGYVPPNDFERILLGRFQGNTSQANQVRNRIGQRRLYGNSGFVFE
jgi:pilus assembly protein CpaC